MWQAKTGPVFGKQFYEACIVCKNIDWPRFDLREHSLMEVLDLKRHEANVSKNANAAQDALCPFDRERALAVAVCSTYDVASKPMTKRRPNASIACAMRGSFDP